MADDRREGTTRPAGRGAREAGPDAEQGQDALELLRRDHREVERLFAQYPRATVAQKDTVFEEIKHELDAHAAIEEELFYPALKAGGGALAALEQAELEHFGVKTAMAAIAKMQPDDPRYDAMVQELADHVRTHVSEEEGPLFAMARQCLGAERLRELGEQMATRKAALREEMADLA